jgi:hypothetical protein
MQVVELCKVVYQVASATKATVPIYNSLTSHYHDDNSVHASQMKLITHALKRMLISFDVVLKGWRTSNPNSDFAIALWDSLHEVQHFDSVRNEFEISRLKPF